MAQMTRKEDVTAQHKSGIHTCFSLWTLTCRRAFGTNMAAIMCHFGEQEVKRWGKGASRTGSLPQLPTYFNFNLSSNSKFYETHHNSSELGFCYGFQRHDSWTLSLNMLHWAMVEATNTDNTVFYIVSSKTHMTKTDGYSQYLFLLLVVRELVVRQMAS